MTPAARRDFRQQGSAVRHALRPGSVTLESGRVYDQGTVSLTSATAELMDGGLLSGQVLTWRIEKQHLPAGVTDNAILTYGGAKWIVREISGAEAWKDAWTIKATK